MVDYKIDENASSPHRHNVKLHSIEVWICCLYFNKYKAQGLQSPDKMPFSLLHFICTFEHGYMQCMYVFSLSFRKKLSSRLNSSIERSPFQQPIYFFLLNSCKFFFLDSQVQQISAKKNTNQMVSSVHRYLYFITKFYSIIQLRYKVESILCGRETVDIFLLFQIAQQLEIPKSRKK